jgi:hypothetical protein
MPLSKPDKDAVANLSAALADGINSYVENKQLTTPEALQNTIALAELELAIEALANIFFEEITKQAGATIIISALLELNAEEENPAASEQLGEIAIYSKAEKRNLNDATSNGIMLFPTPGESKEGTYDQTLLLVQGNEAMSYFVSMVLGVIQEGKKLQLQIKEDAEPKQE